MKKNAVSLAFILVVVLTAQSYALNRDAFTFVRYNLKVRIQPAVSGMDVEGTVELRNDSKTPQKDVAMQITSTFRWLNVQANGQPVSWLTQPYTSDIDHTGELSEAIVSLPAPVPPEGYITLNVHYGGTVKEDSTRLTRIGTPQSVAFRSDWDRIGTNFTTVRGLGFVTWYPVSIDAVSLSDGTEVFDALAGWKFRHTNSQMNLSIMANVEPGEVDKDSSVFIDCPSGGWQPGAGFSKPAQCSFPHVGKEDPAFAISPFQQMERPQLNVMYRAEHTQYARDYAVAAENALTTVTGWFGPVKHKATIVELPDPDALPYEAGTFLFTPVKKLPEAALEVALARLMTHSCFDSPRPWVREGLAVFAQALVREQQEGRKAGLRYLNQFVNALSVAEEQSHGMVPDGPPGKATAVPQPLISTNDELFLRTKAGFVWWMLRDLIGDEAMRKFIKSYNPAEDKDSGYVQRLAEAAGAHKDLEAFFDSWVYRDHLLPDFKIDSAYARKTLSNTYLVAVTVENLGDSWAEVPVVVQSAEGERMSRIALGPKAKGIARIVIPALPTDVVVNDGSVPEENLNNNRAKVTTADMLH